MNGERRRIIPGGHPGINRATIDCPTANSPVAEIPPITTGTATLDDVVNALNGMKHDLEAIHDVLRTPTGINIPNPYDNQFTIATAQQTKLAAGSSLYQLANIWLWLHHNVPKITISNEGPGFLYVRTTDDGQKWTDELPIEEGAAKTYTNIHDLASRAPIAGLTYTVTELDIFKMKNVDFKSGRGYIRNAAIPVGDATPATAYTLAVTHDINASLHRNATTGYIKNRDSVGTLYCWVSADGVQYGQAPAGQGVGIEYFTVDPNSAINLDGWEVFSVKISANLNNIAYEIAVG